MRQPIASLPDSVGIDCLGTLLDVSHDSLLIDQVCCANRQVPRRVQDAVPLADRPIEIAQQRESQTEFLGKTAVTEKAVNTDAKDLNIIGFVMCDISLIRL